MNVQQIGSARVDGREPPWDLQAEEATIASCFADPACAASVVALITADDFYSGGNRAFFEAITHLVESGHPVDLVTAASRLRDVGKLGMVDGAGGMSSLVHRASALGNPDTYARKVRELAQLRALLFAVQRIEGECYSPTDEPAAIVARAETSILALTQATDQGGTVSLLESAKAVARSLEQEREGARTGFAELDDLTTGLQSGEVWILAARPGMGKTGLALEIALCVAESGTGVLFASLEMTHEALMMRALSARARVPMQDLRHRRVTPAQWSRITPTASALAALPFRIYDKPASLRDIHAQARRVAATLKRAKLGLIVIDHIGLVRPSVSGRGNREQEVAEVSRGMKNMAKSLGVPILALCQCGRDVAKGARRPQLQDLRESGSIEQDADTVIAIHRPAYYDRDTDEQMQRYAELIVLKQRNGDLGIVPLDFDGKHVAFSESKN